jgi:hypothetical protein
MRRIKKSARSFSIIEASQLALYEFIAVRYLLYIFKINAVLQTRIEKMRMLMLIQEKISVWIRIHDLTEQWRAK